jgi:ParB family chromosome partitioning protein
LASKKLGLERVPAIVKNVDVERERLELAIIENLQRENLNAVEMARAFARLQDEFRLTQREIATRLGKSREVVANTLRLLDLPPMIQKAIEENKITESHGRVLLGIADVGAQQRLFYELLSKPLTIRELKAKMKGMEGGESVSVAQGFVQGRMQPRLKLFEDRLSADLGAPVKISQHGESGRIVINYYSKEELEQILQKLRLQEEEG